MCTTCFQGICCCCTCCCKECMESLEKGLGKEKITKICYLFIVIVFTVPAILILFFINSWSGFKDYFTWMRCPQASGGNFECIGASTVFRISLSFLVLFGIMAILMLCRNRMSMAVNEGLFFVKYIIVLGVFIGFLFISAKTFDHYAQASKYFSIIYMIIQSIILIDLFYLAGIKLVKRYDNGQTSCAVVLVILTLIFQAIAVALNIYGYVLFQTNDKCGSSLWVNIITSIILAILPIFQFFNFNKQNSLLTTSLVSAYISYLAFICQFSFGGSQCNDRLTVRSVAVDIIISTLLFFLTTYGTIMGGSGQMKISQNADLNQAMGVAPVEPSPTNQNLQMKQKKYKQEPKSEEVVQTEQTNLAKYSQGWGWFKWHLFMCIAAIYLGMLVTNWTSVSLTTGDLVSSDFGFWVRVAISWFVALLYIWTLVAPRIFPERDFTVE